MVMLWKWAVMKGACSCYIGGQFNGGRTLMLQKSPV